MMEGSLFFVRLIRRMTTINLHEMKCAKKHNKIYTHFMENKIKIEL